LENKCLFEFGGLKVVRKVVFALGDSGYGEGDGWRNNGLKGVRISRITLDCWKVRN
jgi:hypothetical protein